MAKNGFKMIDAEMHVMEPVDLWNRYIDPEFKARAPRRLNERRWDIRTMVEGEVMAAMPGGDWPALTDVEEKTLGDRYAEEIARDFDPESQVRAMDKEGLDLAILFPTSAMYITAFETMDARRRRRSLQAARHRAHRLTLRRADARLHGHHHGRRDGALSAPALRLPGGAVRLAALLAASHGRAPRVARALRRDDASHDAAVGILPSPGLLRGGVRRGVREARRRGLWRRQPRHHHRLPARRLQVSEGHGSLPHAAAERQEQEEDPVGQRAQAVRVVTANAVTR